ncbi:MAG TPA: hypothetical protein ENN97_01760 [Phycisphaerales bacterium]|nr:hypothetical protein [Phycisphaerales bacterium]
MRKTNKVLTIRRVSVFLATFCLAAAGCRDNPQDKAAKEVHQQIQAALAAPDKAAARQQIQAALASHRPTGLAQDSAHLAAANLALDQGLSLRSELMLQTLPLRKAADAIASELKRSQGLLLEKERIGKMLTQQDEEIVELNALLTGAAEQPGLRTRLTEAQRKLNELTSQREALMQQKNDIQAIIDDSQARSETLLRQADLAKGDEKLSLQTQAYDLMLERTQDYVQVQAVENQIGILNDRLALTKLHVESLTDNIRQTTEKIEALQTDPNRQMLQEQLSDIDRMLSAHQEKIAAYAEAIHSSLDAYRQTARQAIELFEQAAEQYQKVRSADAVAAAIRQADSYAYAAMVYADQISFLRRITSRIAGIMDAVDEALVRGLPERLPLRMDGQPELFEAVIALYDKADQAYENAMERARRIPERGREAACNVLKNRILALYSKMHLADTIGQYDLAAQVQERLDQLKEQGQEFGSLFTHSEIARLVDQGLDYVPALPVNVELYFESIRQRLTEWKRLSEPEQQAAAVEQNLAEMEELVRTYGDEMARLLEPLKQEMEAAKARDFAAPAPAPGMAADPNSL